MDKVLVVAESYSFGTEPDVLTFTWNGYSENGKQKSILAFVEDSAENFRTQYLDFIAFLGNAQKNDDRLSNYFLVNDGPSLWWMSLLAEKSTYKSPRIIDCIRLMALEKILLIHKPEKVVFCIDDRPLADSVRLLCERLTIEFSWRKRNRWGKLKNFSSDRFLYFYNKFTAAAYLIFYFLSRWPLKDSKVDSRFNDKGSVFFASYLYNLDLPSAGEGVYQSRQWGSLPEFINKNGYKTLHLEHFIKSPAIRSPRSARRIISRLNRSLSDQLHMPFDGPLSLKILWDVVVDYFKLTKKEREIEDVSDLFNVPNSELNLWPILKSDWFCSFVGKTAVSNLILIELFSRHMQRASFQKVGFYLCENIAWERAFIKAWRNNQHGKLVAVPHSTIRFWDLRYFASPDLNRHPAEVELPFPDIYAVNGKMARNALVQNGYPTHLIENVEALRYQFLEDYLEDPVIKSREVNNSKVSAKKILILGDFTRRQTSLMLRSLETLVSQYDFQASYTLKPHPVCDIDVKDYPLLKGNQTTEPLQNIVDDFDLVFGSNVTTASLDCFLMQSKVIVFLDDYELNSSPLRGIKTVQFVSGPDELHAAIKGAEVECKSNEVHDFFWVESKMPKWEKLFNRLIN